MRSYKKPEITEVKLSIQEQVLNFCRTAEPGDRDVCWNAIGDRFNPLNEIYGPQ